VQPAVLDQRVDYRAALAASSEPKNSQFSYPSSGPNGVLDQIVVDLHFPVLQEAFQHGPLVEGITDGLAHQALGQVARQKLLQSTAKPLDHHPMVRAALDLSPYRPGSVAAQLSSHR